MNYELIPILARTHTLRPLLAKNFYGEQEYKKSCGMSDEGSLNTATGACHTFEDLGFIIQASDKELLAGLQHIGAIEIDGCWRLLDPVYSAAITDHILDLIPIHEWPLDALPIRQIEENVEGEKLASRLLARHCLLQMCENGSEEAKGEDTVRLSAKKVSLFRALQLFSLKNPYQKDEFVKDWEVRVPLGITPTLDMLKGFALVEDGVLGRSEGALVKTQQIRYFPVESLSHIPEARFQHLFEVRDAWMLEELTPYVIDLTSATTTLEQLLLKLTRPIRAPNQPAVGKPIMMYTKR